MKSIRLLLVVGTVLAFLVTPALAKKKVPFEVGLDVNGTYTLSESAIDAALKLGAKNRGKTVGLSLRDKGQGFLAAMDRMDDGRSSVSTGFSLEAYTPYAWVAQNSSWAAKRYQEMTREDVTEEMTDAILTVFVHPDSPRQVSADGMVGTSGVDHVIVRSTSKKNFQVLQPTSIEAGSELQRNAFGAEIPLSSAVAYFNIDEVMRISSLDKKGEFFIVVIGDTGEEKKFKVKTKHFKHIR